MYPLFFFALLIAAVYLAIYLGLETDRSPSLIARVRRGAVVATAGSILGIGLLVFSLMLAVGKGFFMQGLILCVVLLVSCLLAMAMIGSVAGFIFWILEALAIRQWRWHSRGRSVMIDDA